MRFDKCIAAFLVSALGGSATGEHLRNAALEEKIFAEELHRIFDEDGIPLNVFGERMLPKEGSFDERNHLESASSTEWSLPYLSRRLNEVTFLTAHNAHAQLKYQNAPGHANQQLSMYEMMKLHKVRGLMIDIRYEDGVMELTHANDQMGLFGPRMQAEIVKFLEENPTEVLWFDIQMTSMGTDIPLSKTKPYLEEAINQIPGLQKRIFNYKDTMWNNHDEWPTLQELVEADQRVVMVIDSPYMVGSYGSGFIMNRDEVVMESMYGGAGLDPSSCVEREPFGRFKNSKLKLENPTRAWSRLFTMNHFPTFALGPWIGGFGSKNDWDSLYKHIRSCMATVVNGKKPNFVAIDWIGYQPKSECIIDVINDGGAVLHEGNDAKDDIICGISTRTTKKINMETDKIFRCDMDEARSMVLFNVLKDTIIKVCDGSDCSPDDDSATVKVLKNTSQQTVVPTFEESKTTSEYIETFIKKKCTMRLFRGTSCLDGEVSAIEITAPSKAKSISW